MYNLYKQSPTQLSFLKQFINPFNLVIVAMVLVVAFVAVKSWSAEAGIPAVTPIGPYPVSVAANDLDVSWTAADEINNNTFASTGKEILLLRNVSSSTILGVTLISVADNLNRKNDIVDYQIGTNEFAAFKFSNTVGWKNTAGNVVIDSSSSEIEFLLIQFP